MPGIREYSKLNVKDIGSTLRGMTRTEPLLLPDEICLAEDRQIYFDLFSQQEGLCLFSKKDVNIRVRVKTYLTNYRVCPFPINLTIS